jgi:hypothetical protein
MENSLIRSMEDLCNHDLKFLLTTKEKTHKFNFIEVKDFCMAYNITSKIRTGESV